MRARKAFLIVGFLCCWTVLSYVIYVRKSEPLTVHNTLGNAEHSALLQKLKLLEEQIQYESERHDALLRQFIKIVKVENDKKPAEVVTPSTSSRIPMPNIAFKNIDNVGPVHKLAVAHVERIDTDSHGGSLSDVDNDGQDIKEENKDESAVKEIPLDNRLPSSKQTPELKVKALLKENIKNNHFDGPVIPVIVFACNRVSVRLALDNLLQYRPNTGQFPIIVSQVSVSNGNY